MKQIIGVTGGIASGKSNVCNIIEQEGYPVIDCDKITAELSVQGGLLYNVIVKEFGEDFLLDNGDLDRKKLAKKIFNDSKSKEALDKITHPIIYEEVKKRLDKISDGLVFLEAPLLYESKFDSICDKIICVFLQKRLQVQRLMDREGIDEDYALAKIHSQMDLYIKKSLADYVIDSKGTFDETKLLVLNVINDIKGVL
ncbi:MAG: dephospho-CoA kinase [Acholeplasmatales bacterium]|nr:dephospho-CoA kinase [Acholeplasmatales bacterium]